MGIKAVILAGGLGTRLSEETSTRPKPMVEIGGRPILWHIMKMYSAHGVNDFVICCGYKGYMIKEYFANYCLHMSDVTFDMATGRMQVHRQRAEPWSVTLVDTGDDSMTGGRLRRVRNRARQPPPKTGRRRDALAMPISSRSRRGCGLSAMTGSISTGSSATRRAARSASSSRCSVFPSPVSPMRSCLPR